MKNLVVLYWRQLMAKQLPDAVVETEKKKLFDDSCGFSRLPDRQPC